MTWLIFMIVNKALAVGRSAALRASVQNDASAEHVRCPPRADPRAGRITGTPSLIDPIKDDDFSEQLSKVSL